MRKKKNNFDIVRLILLFFLIVPTFRWLLRPGYFSMHDDMQAMRVLQLGKCIEDLQIPCRWVPDMGYGYGYPQFNYYGPLPYYLMYFVSLSNFGVLESVKAGFVLSIIVGAFGMYLWGRKLWGSYGGFISSIVYAYLPYKALDIYVRGAMSESWAFSILPFVFWSIELCFSRNKHAVIYLSLSFSALLMSHNITTMIAMPFIVLWVLIRFLTIKGNDRLQFVKNLFIGFFLGFLTSSFYLIPAFLEKKYVHVETLTYGYFDYRRHFVGLFQLLFSSFWGYGSSEIGPYDELNLSIGLVPLILPILGLLGHFLVKKNRKFYLFLTLFLFGWASLFLIHPRSVFIWNSLPLLKYVQFPWRFLALSGLFLSACSGFFTYLIVKAKFRTVLLITGIIVFLYSSYFQPKDMFIISDNEKFSGELWEKQRTISIFDYLPKSAQFPPGEAASDKPILIDGDIDILSYFKGSNWYRWKISVSRESVMKLPIIYFPNWSVWIDGSVSSFSYDNPLGLITIRVPPGKHEIYAKLLDTNIRKVSNYMSFLGLILISYLLYKIKTDD